ncbi:hypothetical protein ACKLNR_014532 [Fusarium oxysporum f. sp. zingiberi]
MADAPHISILGEPSKELAAKMKKDAISQIANGEVGVDRSLLKGTIGQIVLELAQKRYTMPSAAQQKFAKDIVGSLSKNWDTEIL